METLTAPQATKNTNLFEEIKGLKDLVIHLQIEYGCCENQEIVLGVVKDLIEKKQDEYFLGEAQG